MNTRKHNLSQFDCAVPPYAVPIVVKRLYVSMIYVNNIDDIGLAAMPRLGKSPA